MCSDEEVGWGWGWGGKRVEAQCSLRLPLQVGDVVQRDDASVGGADAADVAEAQEAGDARQAHTGAVQVQVSEMHVFQELYA